jgi:hypothetical protein
MRCRCLRFSLRRLALHRASSLPRGQRQNRGESRQVLDVRVASELLCVLRVRLVRGRQTALAALREEEAAEERAVGVREPVRVHHVACVDVHLLERCDDGAEELRQQPAVAGRRPVEAREPVADVGDARHDDPSLLLLHLDGGEREPLERRQLDSSVLTARMRERPLPSAKTNCARYGPVDVSSGSAGGESAVSNDRASRPASPGRRDAQQLRTKS